MLSKKFSALLLAVLATTILSACDVDQVEITNKDGEKTVVDVTTTKEELPSENPEPEVEVIATDVDYQFPEKLNTREVMGNYIDDIESAIPDNYGANLDNVLGLISIYDVGEIKKAPYEGQRLLVMSLDCEGTCFSADITRFTWKEATGDMKVLKNHSVNDFTPIYLEFFYQAGDSSFTLSSLELPKTIMLPDGSDSVTLKMKDTDMKTNQNAGGENPYGLRFTYLDEVAFTDDRVGKVYMADNTIGCLFVLGPDNVVSTYTYDSGLTDEKNMQVAVWDDGSDSDYMGGSYTLKTGGCGIGAACYYIEDIPENQLVKVGATDLGIDLYQAKNTDRVEDKAALNDLIDTNRPQWELNDTYNTYVSMNENGYLNKGEPVSSKTYAEYLEDHPILYWKDPFERLSGIVHTQYKAPAECGEPVIYLYPEKETTVNVQVGIDEFTVTEPAYGENGWTVIAKPNGELFNLADGQKYEYLFWEGLSDEKLEMNAGFVVAKDDLENFLEKSLVELGLNEKESADFMEFWVPKMMATDHPYVLVSFVGTRDFDKVAPLTVEPKPDTVIRVFMYYQPLWYKINMPPQVLSAPERNGFTLIEWGGTSSDGWQIR